MRLPISLFAVCGLATSAAWAQSPDARPAYPITARLALGAAQRNRCLVPDEASCDAVLGESLRNAFESSLRRMFEPVPADATAELGLTVSPLAADIVDVAGGREVSLEARVVLAAKATGEIDRLTYSERSPVLGPHRESISNAIDRASQQIAATFERTFADSKPVFTWMRARGVEPVDSALSWPLRADRIAFIDVGGGPVIGGGDAAAPGLLATFGQGVVDIATDATHALLYLAAPPNVPTHANSVLAFHPMEARIVGSVAATNPTTLAVTGDGQFLYVHAEDSVGSVLTRYDLPGLTGSTSVVLGQKRSVFGEVQPAPGAPHTTAVSVDGFSIAVLDDGVRRGAALSVDASLQWGLDATQLFALDGFSTFRVLSVDSTGLTVRKTLNIPGIGQATRIRYEPTNRRIYSDAGAVVDDQATSASTLGAGPSSGCSVTTDGAIGKAFFACLEDLTYAWALTVRSFDLANDARIGTLALATWPRTSLDLLEQPVRIVRWGTDGLAVATRRVRAGTGKLYLYNGAFVR